MSNESFKVYASIQKVAGIMSNQGVGKGRKNEQQGYQFRGIDEVINALSAALVAADLVILPRVMERNVIERQTRSGGALFYVTVKVEFTLVNTVDGSKAIAVIDGEAMDSADKATNKAISAAYKYMAITSFCIPTVGMPDADQVTHDVAPHNSPIVKPVATAPGKYPLLMPDTNTGKTRVFDTFDNLDAWHSAYMGLIKRARESEKLSDDGKASMIQQLGEANRDVIEKLVDKDYPNDNAASN